MKSLKFIVLVLLSLGVIVNSHDLQSALSTLQKFPTSFLSQFAKGASVCHHLTGKCWEPSRLRDTLEFKGLSLDPSLFNINFDVNQNSRMVWIQGESDSFDSNGLVMLKEKDEWKILRLNITEKFSNFLEISNEKKQEAIKLRIMSFNIRYGTANDGLNSWYLRDHLVFKVLSDYQPELVGLQEALLFQIEEIVAAHPTYKWIGVGRDNGVEAGEFAAILYDTSKFEVLEQGTFWYCDKPTVPGCTSYGNTLPRICTWGRFISKITGRTFFHFNTHLDHMSSVSRELSSQQLLDFILTKQNGDPFMITGDFNCNSESSKEITILTNSSFVDTFRDLYPNATDVGTFHSFNGGTSGTKIDYVFGATTSSLGGPCQVEQAAIIHDNENGRYPSDHFPVEAILTFP